ncbi:MAG: DUF2269 domain-containing protein [Hyphomicrobiaceae bacterium]|nr:DUF2269 domain-containing protein [Hyphomicrobiaceae bacterium]
MTYQVLKALHILGIILFFSNIIVTGFWKTYANRTGQPEIIAFAQRLVSLTDWIFTAGGVTLLMIGAYGMAYVNGWDLLGERWLIWGQGLFFASGLIWVAILIPVQTKQAHLARGFADGSPIPEQYWQLKFLGHPRHPAAPRQPLLDDLQTLMAQTPFKTGVSKGLAL